MRRHLLAVPLLSLAFACGQCSTPLPTPVDAGPCPAGTVGCACGADASCARGQCVAGTCSLCTRGEEACVCRRDGSCKDALVCTSGLCRTCPAGTGGCACDEGSCEEGFTCDANQCVAATCKPGSAECPCRQASSPACDGTLACLGDNVCHACEADRAGCGCTAETGCSTGLVCDEGTCRIPPSCADLVAEGFCQPKQVCTQTPGDTAVCEKEQCVAGFVWDRGRCVPGSPNCAEDRVGSQLSACTSQLRQCLEDASGARCGDCIQGSRDVDGVCVGRLSCGNTSCLESQYCDRAGNEPVCLPLACAPGDAKAVGGPCRPCGFTCSGAGLTGRVWPFRTITDTCVCETLPGFFMPPGGDTRAEICDQDGDGWVRAEVRDSALTTDPALVQNERCPIIEVPGVRLRDELGTDAFVASCAEGLLLNPEPTACSSTIPLALLESLRNDTPGPLLATSTPAYGGTQGRRLRANEVNGLTKGCVSALADFNDNQVEDYLEVQADPAVVGVDPLARLRSFAYFMETNRSYVERHDGADQLVIEERYRCDPRDFPLHYDPAAPADGSGDAFSATSGATYWRSCQRGVAPGFDPTADPPVPGWDFAQWSCPHGSAGCTGVPVAPPHPRLDLRTPIAPETNFPDDATLCRLGSRFPADHTWRGFNHASQFQCVGVGTGPGRKPASEFGVGGHWVMNRCRAAACASGDATCSDSRTVVPGSQAFEPAVSCQALESVGGDDFGFAARRYTAYGVGFTGTYAGGCVSEDEEYRDTMCPPPVFAVAPSAEAFGKNTCFIAPCQLGRANCDGNALNGCELDATNNANCNGCNVRCAPANATGNCSTGVCRVGTCSTGWADCDGRGDNGCETSTRTLQNCGGCNQVCDIPASDESCATGTCEGVTCVAGKGDCNNSDVDGCETSLNTAQNCGGCGIPCAPTNGTGTCTSGTCVVTSCDPGFGECDGSAANGCESPLNTTSNCTACNSKCTPANAVGQCTGGAVCTVGTCNKNYGDCDGSATNGCETPLTTLTNCGSCRGACSLANATSDCSTGKCTLTACNGGKADCDNNASNGCETDLSAAASCGSATDAGSQGADSQCGPVCTVNTPWVNFSSTTGRGPKWFKARALDALGVCSEDLTHRVTLTVPTGVDYDLRIWDQCAGTLLYSSTNAAGTQERITIVKEDHSTADRSFNYWVEVVFHAGSSCAEWTLNFEGRNTKC